MSTQRSHIFMATLVTNSRFLWDIVFHGRSSKTPLCQTPSKIPSARPLCSQLYQTHCLRTSENYERKKKASSHKAVKVIELMKWSSIIQQLRLLLFCLTFSALDKAYFSWNIWLWNKFQRRWGETECGHLKNSPQSFALQAGLLAECSACVIPPCNQKLPQWQINNLIPGRLWKWGSA